MTNALTTTPAAALATRTAEDDQRTAAQLGAHSTAPNTRRAYASDWNALAEYATTTGQDATSPATVAAFIGRMVSDGRPWSTIARRLSGVRAALKAQGIEDATAHPAVREVVKGARRTVTVATRNERAPLLVEDLTAMLATLGECAKGYRDRAILLVGFGMGARRSEIVALDVEDLAFTPRGVTITIRQSKTDQTGQGRVLALPFGRPETCPVRALQTWLDFAGITSGPVFRGVDRHQNIAGERLTDRAVANVIKRTAERAGLDSTRLGGHSLRAGLVTSAALAGVAEADIQRQTGHRSVAMVRRYTRVADVYRNNAAGALL